MRIFVHTICFGQKFVDENSANQKNYKNSGFSRNCPKPKMTPFLKKVFFDMGEKVSFTNCVFEKLCSSENTIAIRKLYVEQNRKFMKNSELFLNMAKWCFGGCFLSFNGFVVCFLCVW